MYPCLYASVVTAQDGRHLSLDNPLMCSQPCTSCVLAADFDAPMWNAVGWDAGGYRETGFAPWLSPPADF